MGGSAVPGPQLAAACCSNVWGVCAWLGTVAGHFCCALLAGSGALSVQPG